MSSHMEMMRGVSNLGGKLVLAALLIGVAVVLSMSADGLEGRNAFTSSEVQFSDSSALSDFAVIPASCPSSPHYPGDCSTNCPSGYVLVNGQCVIETTTSECPLGFTLIGGQCFFTGCPAGYSYQNGQCVVVSCPSGYVLQNGSCVFAGCPSGYALVSGQCVPQTGCPSICIGNNLVNVCTQASQACSYQCSSGACIAPPPPEGSISAIPGLMQSGSTVTVTWSAQYAESCTVTGTNGDGTGSNSTGTWDTVSGSRTSSALTIPATYTLACTGYDGTTLTESVTVGIVPIFQEL